MTLLHRELVYTDPNGVETWNGVLTTPSGFLVSTSTKRSGLSVNGKSWTRFQEQNVEFYSLRSGKLRIYGRSRLARDYGRRASRSKMGPIRDRTATVITRSGRPSPGAALRDIGSSHLGFDSFVHLVDKEFPLADQFSTDMSGVLALTRNGSLVEASRELLGRHYQKGFPRALAAVDTLYPKDLRSAFAQTAMIFQGIVPTDWIVDLLVVPPRNMVYSMFYTRDEMRRMRRALRTGTATQLRRLTRNPPPNFMVLLRDSLRRFDSLEGLDFRSVQELHDTLVPAPRPVIPFTGQTYEKPEPMAIKYSGNAAKFLGEWDEFSVVAPESSEDLYEWSDFMHNCISGYAPSAAEGHSLLYAVKNQGVMVANIELDPLTGSVRQLLGKYNQSLDSELSSLVKSRVLSVWPNADVNNGWE